MANKTFSIKEALAYGWGAAKSNLLLFAGLLVTVWVVGFIPAVINRYVTVTAVAVIIGLVFRLVQWFLQLGLFKISLQVVDGKPSAYPDLFSGGPLYVKYLIATVLYGIAVMIGVLLLIVPGVIVSLMLLFYGFLIIDKGLSPIDALKASHLVTKGAKWQLFLFGLATLGLNIVGALCLLVGLFVTVPMTLLALAHVYRKLLAQTPEVA